MRKLIMFKLYLQQIMLNQLVIFKVIGTKYPEFIDDVKLCADLTNKIMEEYKNE